MNLMIYLTFLAEIHTTKYNHQALMILPLLIRKNGDTGTATSRPFARMLAAEQQLPKDHRMAGGSHEQDFDSFDPKQKLETQSHCFAACCLEETLS